MIHKAMPLFAALTMACGATAQTPDALDNFISRALARSPKVQAARLAVEAKRLDLSGLRSGANPRVELAPGLGFTNGSMALSQELDVFGIRAARTRVAEAELRLADAQRVSTNLEVATQVLGEMVALEAAAELAVSSAAAADLARELLLAVRRRAGAGEVPQVQVTRAELELLRYEQTARRHAAERDRTLAALSSLVGPEAANSVPPLALGERVARAKGLAARSPEMLTRAVGLEVLLANVGAVAASSRPTLTAGIASDVWSLDRRAMTSSNLGLQVFLSAPLFDRGEDRKAVASARASAEAADSEYLEARRAADLAKQAAESRLQAAESIVAAYQTDAIPKGEALLRAMREGYAAGLVTLIEVIEAQQTLAALNKERTEALLALRESELALLRSTLALPGVEVPR